MAEPNTWLQRRATSLILFWHELKSLDLTDASLRADPLGVSHAWDGAPEKLRAEQPWRL